MKTKDEIERLQKTLREGFAQAHETNLLWLAVQALLEYQIETAVETVCSPALTNEVSHFARGDLAGLRAFQAALDQARAKAMTESEAQAP